LKQSVTDVLRRGFDSTLANWQLIGIRIAESFLLVMIIVMSIIAAVVPVALSAGLSNFDFKHADDPGQFVMGLILEHWVLIVYILLIASFILAVLIAIHAFVDAGNARVFIDAEQRVRGTAAPPRDVLRAFDINRWLKGGRGSWWTVFWIYNLVWGIGGLIIVIPLLATIAGMLMVSEMGGRVAVACGGLFLTFVVALPLAIIMAIVVQKATIVAVARSAGASDSLRLGWREIRDDFGRHFAVAFIVFVIAFGGAMVISLFTAPMSIIRNIGHTPFTNIAFAPAQILSSIAQTIFSAAVGLWFLASYVGLTEKR